MSTGGHRGKGGVAACETLAMGKGEMVACLGSADSSGQDNIRREKQMTKREREQLERLLEKKEREEKHDHEFFSEVRRRKAEVLRVLDINEDAAQAVQNRAEAAGIPTEQMINLINHLSPEWIQRAISRQ